MFSALEGYLDDLDAELQLERELMQTCHAKAGFRAQIEQRDAG